MERKNTSQRGIGSSDSSSVEIDGERRQLKHRLVSKGQCLYDHLYKCEITSKLSHHWGQETQTAGQPALERKHNVGRGGLIADRSDSKQPEGTCADRGHCDPGDRYCCIACAAYQAELEAKAGRPGIAR